MGQVFSLDRLKQTGKALKDVTVQGAIATKDGVVTATNATILAFILTKDAIMSVAWGPAKAIFDEIWNQLERPVAEHGAILHCIKVYETENNFVEYFGE